MKLALLVSQGRSGDGYWNVYETLLTRWACLAGLFGGLVWRVCLAGLFCGLVWLAYAHPWQDEKNNNCQ